MAYYKAHVFCCTNERPPGHERGCCKDKGAEKLRNYMKSRLKELKLNKDIRINTAGCLDRCELGPVMVIYPEAAWYTYATTADVEEIIERHLKNGERVERLLLTDEQKELRADQAEGRAGNTAVC